MRPELRARGPAVYGSGPAPRTRSNRHVRSRAPSDCPGARSAPLRHRRDPPGRPPPGTCGLDHPGRRPRGPRRRRSYPTAHAAVERARRPRYGAHAAATQRGRRGHERTGRGRRCRAPPACARVPANRRPYRPDHGRPEGPCPPILRSDPPHHPAVAADRQLGWVCAVVAAGPHGAATDMACGFTRCHVPGHRGPGRACRRSLAGSLQARRDLPDRSASPRRGGGCDRVETGVVVYPVWHRP